MPHSELTQTDREALTAAPLANFSARDIASRYWVIKHHVALHVMDEHTVLAIGFDPARPCGTRATGRVAWISRWADDWQCVRQKTASGGGDKPCTFSLVNVEGESYPADDLETTEDLEVLVQWLRSKGGE